VARVPEKFLSVQWLKVPNGRSTPALEALCRRIASDELTMQQATPKPTASRRVARAPATSAALPGFPTHEPGQKVRFWFEVFAWACRTVWVGFKRLPRWIRILVYVWLGVLLLSRGCTGDRDKREDISPATAAKLNTIAQQYQGSSNGADISRLGAQIAREIAGDSEYNPSRANAMLAIPFVAPAGAAAAAKLADSAFAMVYGRLAVSRHGHVALAQQPLASGELGAALERGLAHHSTYVLFGAIEHSGATQVLGIKIASVEARSVLWSKAYPVVGSDPAMIASDVDSKVPVLED
jgi:hypothetical protein